MFTAVSWMFTLQMGGSLKIPRLARGASACARYSPHGRARWSCRCCSGSPSPAQPGPARPGPAKSDDVLRYIVWYAIRGKIYAIRSMMYDLQKVFGSSPQTFPDSYFVNWARPGRPGSRLAQQAARRSARDSAGQPASHIIL